jgi:hypothetical protein
MNLAVVSTKLAVVGGPKAQLALAKINKFSPQILTAVGVVGGIASTVLIAKASMDLEPIVTNHEEGKASIQLNASEGVYETEGERSAAIRKLYIRSGLDLVKLYGPGVSLGVASIVSVVAAQGIAQKRQVAMVAAVKSAESAFQAYRARVIESIGEEKEAEIRYGVSTEVVEDENGKKTKVKSFSADGLSPYTYVFDETNKSWQRGNRELNFLYLKNMQNWANDRLNARGYVYLNEVYSWMGIPEVAEGQVIGWLHKDFDNGDGYIDFGWDNIGNTKFGDKLDGILLDFNVDGEINSKL